LPFRLTLTNALVALMLVAWVLVLVSRRADEAAVLGGMIPARLSGAGVLPGAVPAWLTPITGAFLHGSLLHVGLNALMLLFCGKQVEPAIGPKLMALLLLVGAYAAAVAEMLWAPSSDAVIIGASGAISAVVGVYALLYNQQNIKAIGPIPAHVVRIAWLAAAWIGFQVLVGFGLGGTIAVMAHIGGFVVGLLLARPLLRWRYRSA
jgi:membrane associated rhomboid family serine protease